MTMTLGRRPAVDTLPDLTRESIDQRHSRRGGAEWTAIAALIAGIIFQPILHPAGPGNSAPVDIFLLASIILTAVWARSGHHKLRAPYFIPVAIMVGAGAASGIVGPLPGVALTSLAIDLLLFAWCTAIVNVLGSPRPMRYALVAWSWAGILWAALVVAAWLGHVTALEGLNAADGNRVLFTFGDPNYAATYWTVTIFVVYAARTPTTWWMRLIGYMTLAWALALSESNGGILALGVGIFFLLLIMAYRRRGMVGSLALGLVIVLAVSLFLAVFPLSQIRQQALHSGQPLLVNSIGRSSQSTSERGELASELVQLYRQSDGLLGLGPASTKPLLSARLYPYANEAHNDFLAALSERGAVGLLGLLLLVGAVALWAAPLVRRPLSPDFAGAVPRPVGLVAALLAVLFISNYEEVLHFRFVWALFGLVAVLGKNARR